MTCGAHWRGMWALAVVACWFTGCGAVDYARIGSDGWPVSRDCSVTRVVSGDTMTLEDGQTLRLLGVRAPRKGERYFEESREFLRLWTQGKRVRVHFEKQVRDNHGDLVGYVMTPALESAPLVNYAAKNMGVSPDDWVFLNERVLAGGLGYLDYAVPGDRVEYTELLEESAREGWRKKRGMWAKTIERPETVTIPDSPGADRTEN